MFSRNPIHENLAESSPANRVANSVIRHVFCWNVFPATPEVHMWSRFMSVEIIFNIYPRGSKTAGGASCLYEEYIYFELNMSAR
jgi:hypothetical protein